MRTKSIFAIFEACLLAGCSFAGKPPVPSGVDQPGAVVPDVVQKGKGSQWVRFTPHTLGALYSAIVRGPDGNVWFLDENAAALVRIGQSGAIKEFSLSGFLGGSAVSMAVGADKKFYILDESTNVVRVTEKGQAQVFPIPSGDSTSIDGVALGPDGNIWFAEFNHVGKITPSGKITEFAYPSGFSANQYGGVAAGADGNVWFAESSSNAIGRIVPSSGKITMFPISGGCTPAPVVLANDKNVWFFCLTSTPMLGRVTPSGKIATFAIGGTFNSNETEQFCSRGPDGEPWCASGNDGNIFRLDSKTQKITTFTPPLGSGARPDALVAGADGNLWVDTVGAEIDVLVLNPLIVKPTRLDFAASGQMQTLSVTENGVTSWSAKSSNIGVATVAQGHSKSSFTVTSIGKGSCKVVIADSVGNSVPVKVTVR
jgi:streptogramin lyase